MIFLELMLEFFRVGLFTFGGGYAAIPLIREVVLGRGWLTESALTGLIAVCESTPGPIMVNLATYVGATQAGFPGALLATLAVVTPSFWVIVLICTLLKNAMKNPYVRGVMDHLKAAIVGMILATGLYLVGQACLDGSQSATWDGKAVLITGILIGILVVWKIRKKKNLSPIALLGLAAVLGMLVYGIF